MNGRFDAIAQQLISAAEAPRASGNILSLIAGASGGSKWRNGLANSGRFTAINHSLARQNARAAMQDSVQARSVVERSADTIADGGLRLELSPMIEVLGVSREYATTWARNTEARFHLWAKDKKQHRACLYNWYQSHPMWQLFRHRDNDQFVRFFYESDLDLQNPLQFDFVDPDQVRGDTMTNSYAPYGQQSGVTTSNGVQLTPADGIDRDSRSREVSYRVWVRMQDGTWDERIVPARFPGGRISMLHGFTPEYAGQGRGYSRLAHAMQEFEKITDFSASVLQRAINQASIFGFVKPSKDEDAVDPIGQIMADSAVGPAAQYLGSEPQNLPGLPPVDAAGLEKFGRVPNVSIDQPGSLWIGNLPKGTDISFPSLTAPGDTYDKFVDAFTGHIAASLKIPLEVVLMKFGQNYSASRATLLLFWRVCVIEREEMAADYLWPTFEMWLAGEIAAGRIVAPGWSDPRMRAAWLNGTWNGSSAPDIDPAKSAKAARENIEIGRTNAEYEAQQYNGTSAADNVAKNNATFGQYKTLPWNETAPTAAPAPAGKAMARLMDEIRDMIQEELGNA